MHKRYQHVNRNFFVGDVHDAHRVPKPPVKVILRDINGVMRLTVLTAASTITNRLRL